MRSYKSGHAKIIAPDAIASLARQIREDNRTIATLNGSFDLVHAGHLYMIEEAAKQCDVLIIAINSDDSIRAYKNPDRPIITLEHRLALLSAFEAVDYLTWFEETNPLNILEKIEPDVHVNGAEYGTECIEAPLLRKIGARLHLVDRIEGLSTSSIVSKIQSLGA